MLKEPQVGAPLTHYVHTLEWFEQKAQRRLREKAKRGPSTLAEAREVVAQSYGVGNWLELDSFCRGAVVLIEPNTLQLKRKLEISIQNAWKYLVEPEFLAEWHIPTELELEKGGKFEFKNAWKGTIGELKIGHCIRFDAEAGGFTTFSLKPENDTTVCVITDVMAPQLIVDPNLIEEGKSVAESQPGGPGTHWHGVTSGWHHGANTLANLVNENPVDLSYEVLDRLYAELLSEYFRRSELVNLDQNDA